MKQIRARLIVLDERLELLRVTEPQLASAVATLRLLAKARAARRTLRSARRVRR